MKHNARPTDPETQAYETLEHRLHLNVVDPPPDFTERTIHRWRAASHTAGYNKNRTPAMRLVAWRLLLQPRLALALTLFLIVVNAIAIATIERQTIDAKSTVQIAPSNVGAAVTALSISDVLEDYQLDDHDLTDDDHEH